MKKDEIIQMRMQQFDKDILHWTEYDFVVVNEDLEKCYNQIIGYLENNLKYEKSIINEHVRKLV